MPDLDLIKQAEQGDAGIRQGRCRRSSPGRRALQPTGGHFAADMLQRQ